MSFKSVRVMVCCVSASVGLVVEAIVQNLFYWSAALGSAVSSGSFFAWR